MRVGKRAWAIERDAEEIYMLSNSQIGQTANANAQFHADPEIFELNTICRVTSGESEVAARYYFKYLVPP
jgi:hypothetical protein